MYITNDVNTAGIAQANTVDIIIVDLEAIGKDVRQAGRNTVRSNHVISDVNKIKEVLSVSELLVRINPLHERSKVEIDEVISRGADIIMLPMFREASEVSEFIGLVGGRAKTMLLAETRRAEDNISKIADIRGIDGIHIGLNDLHIEHGMDFIFELLAYGNVERMCRIIAKRKVPYGFGGIAKLDEGLLPARNIISEHYRLGSSRVILSRSFCDALNVSGVDEIQASFSAGMKEIREFERLLPDMPREFFERNKREVSEKTKLIADGINMKKKGEKKCI
jgi:hypothetical protein